MDNGLSQLFSCSRTPYAPTNPYSGRSPFVSETVVWNSRTQTSKLVPKTVADDFTQSTSSASTTYKTSTTTTDSRVAVGALRPAKTPAAISRYSTETNNPACGPTIKTECSSNFIPSKGKTYTTLSSASTVYRSPFSRDA